MKGGAAIAALMVVSRLAHADGGQGEFEAIGARLAHHEIAADGAIAAYEALASGGGVGRWTDDAWAEAARIAEQRGDLARARTDLEHAAATADDPRAAARAKDGLARLASSTGARGEWTAVAAEHDRLLAILDRPDGSDPRPALAALAALVRANPTYPRAIAARLSLARGWESNGDLDAALLWLDDALASGGQAGMAREHVVLERARFLVRHELAGAEVAIATISDPVMRTVIDEERASRVRAGRLHVIAWIGLALLATATMIAAVRTGVRRLARPPIEVVFAIPIAAVIAIVAATGNPLVARAVRTIAIAGIAIAWIAGSLGARAPRRARLAIAALAAVAAFAVAYLALDRGALATMIVETWRAGPQAH